MTAFHLGRLLDNSCKISSQAESTILTRRSKLNSKDRILGYVSLSTEVPNHLFLKVSTPFTTNTTMPRCLCLIQNDLMLEDSFLRVQRRLEDGRWKDYRTDSHPSTRFEWTRKNSVLGTSSVKVSITMTFLLHQQYFPCPASH